MTPPHSLPAEPAAFDHLREHTLETRPVYQGNFLHVRRDVVRLPDAGTATREYIVHPGAAVVVPILDDGRLVLERQWRYPLARAMLEFPAGKLEPGEPSFHCALRELAEETGYHAAEWAHAGLMHNAIAYSNEGIHVWFARGLSPGPRKLDAGEFLDVEVMDPEQLDTLAATGELTDAKTLVGLLWLQNWRSGRWPLTWCSAEEWLQR